jgi:uncharacterized membrane protein HdeD (DUF308 family)
MNNQVGTPAQLPLAALEELHRHWVRFLILGLLLVVLGTVGIVASGLLTLASVLLLGWILLIAGAAVAAHAFWARRWGGFFVQLIFGLLNLVVGWIMITRPGIAALSLTLLLGVSLVVQGVFRTTAALAAHADGRGWLLVSGIASLLLGILIWSEWPVSGVWVIGLFIGIDLLFYGWWLVSLALSVRHLSAAQA